MGSHSPVPNNCLTPKFPCYSFRDDPVPSSWPVNCSSAFLFIILPFSRCPVTRSKQLRVRLLSLCKTRVRLTRGILWVSHPFSFTAGRRRLYGCATVCGTSGLFAVFTVAVSLLVAFRLNVLASAPPPYLRAGFLDPMEGTHLTLHKLDKLLPKVAVPFWCFTILRLHRHVWEFRLVHRPTGTWRCQGLSFPVFKSA